MHEIEIEAWATWALPETIRAVTTEGALARNDWAARIRRAIELSDLTPWATGGLIIPRLAISAAATVAMEFAILVSLWPERPGDVLRPSWE
jgi:hypothetical protein